MQKNKNGNIKILEAIESKTKIYLVVIALLFIIISIEKPVYIIPSIILYTLIILYTIWVYKKRKDELYSYIDELTFTVDTAAKSTLINSPFPLIILQSDGTIIWRSSNFKQEFENIDIAPYIEDTMKDIKLDTETKEKMKIEKDVEIGEKTYHVIGDYIRIKKKDRKRQKEYMSVIYFVDITHQKDIEKKYDDEENCIGIVMIDNYEEVLQRISEENKSQVTANVEKKLYEWANRIDGIMVKKERDTYILIFTKEKLKELEQERFAIIDEIKEIETEEKMPITLSIAISNEGKNNYEKYEAAHTAMDIVLGRGGDQVIVRSDGKYTFFGGKSPELEKRTKVKARTISHALEELMQKVDNVVIMGHTNGDIDSVGSSLGLYRFAKNFGKEAYIVNNTYGLTLKTFMEELTKFEEYQDVIIDKSTAISKTNQNTLLIVVDTHKKGYVEIPELLELTDKIVIVDHHRKVEDFIENVILSFHEAYASSSAELVTEIIEYATNSIKLETIEAESLYAGIMMDTKNFTFKTGVRTFEAAAYLKKYGVDMIKVKKWFQSDLDTYNIISKVVQDTEIVNDTIGISVYDTIDKNANLICAKVADELLTISNITASFVLGNTGDKICISGRSIGDINVQVILEKMRGRRSYYPCRSSS
ncbi:MAG: DHH family phosphoesterase [Clostridia bacterium]